MATRVFALIIGIDSYQSGGIWNLHSCVEDAKRIRRYLINDLNVPRDQICLLLDNKATKDGIEDSFMRHLTNNTAIERGDAIVIYFAGHGSVIRAPKDWFGGEHQSTSGHVEVLCPYDHDTRRLGGRVAGISDRSMHALLSDLSQIKGDNITFIADCCFTPSQSPANIRQRSRIRWTPTTKAKPNDLYSGLWPGARGRLYSNGFYNVHPTTHTFLAACGPGGKAVEGKEGGRFTSTLLEAVSEIALHRTSYVLLLDHLHKKMAAEGQHPVCLGQYKTRIVFNAIPFVMDARCIPVSRDAATGLRIEVGAIQGIVEGSEFSLHMHNHRGSRNLPIATAVAFDVHATWCFGRVKSPNMLVPKTCWAQITRWNNRRPFRVHLKASLVYLARRWKIRRSIPAYVGGPPSKAGLNILRVKNAAHADISLTIGYHNVSLERHDDDIAANCRRVVKIEKRNEHDIIDDAARFHLHLHRTNPENPLQNLVSMELFRLDPSSWSRVGKNLLEDGKANISYEAGAIFTVIIRNKSDIDLWPYLFYMDPNSYSIMILYHPESSLKTPPLPRRAHLEIGTGQPGSEALSFALPDQDRLDSGFLKLFLAPKAVPVGMIEQGPALALPMSEDQTVSLSPRVPDRIWDTVSACVQFLRH